MELFFDLDGTLTDPAVGITLCLQHAVTRMGGQPRPAHELTRFIGPPLRTTFCELLATEDPARVEAAIDHYRERFADVGMFENAVYADVPAALDRLRADGHRLWLVTSKPEVYARTIAIHFGLDHHFAGMYGSELSGERTDKGELIAHVLERQRLVPERVWMIGDRAHDIIGGRRNGVRTMGVLWGYGTEEELREAKADAIVASMEELCGRVSGPHVG
jgi:phosphoglycolate phosphatase